MSWKERAKRAGRRVGVDVVEWPRHAPAYSMLKALVSGAPEVLLDVGANDGGFARLSRELGYAGPLVSFEPAAAAFTRLRTAARADPQWEVERLALSDRPGVADLHLTDNAGLSSSLRRMLPSHRSAAPEVSVTGVEAVPVTTLDDYLQAKPWSRVALKIDAQGCEQDILRGATDSLPRLTAIQLECSLLHLYEGDWLWHDVSDWMLERGFGLAGVAPVFSSAQTGFQQQFDAVFVREDRGLS